MLRCLGVSACLGEGGLAGADEERSGRGRGCGGGRRGREGHWSIAAGRGGEGTGAGYVKRLGLKQNSLLAAPQSVTATRFQGLCEFLASPGF